MLILWHFQSILPELPLRGLQESAACCHEPATSNNPTKRSLKFTYQVLLPARTRSQATQKCIHQNFGCDSFSVRAVAASCWSYMSASRNSLRKEIVIGHGSHQSQLPLRRCFRRIPDFSLHCGDIIGSE